MRHAPSHGRQRAHGASMIEVLVALALLSFGVLGLGALHGRAMQLAAGAEDRNRAAVLADELATQMWLARSTGLDTGHLSAWRARLANTAASGLPNATGTVSDPDTTGTVTITISWYPPTGNANRAYSYVTKVVIP